MRLARLLAALALTGAACTAQAAAPGWAAAGKAVTLPVREASGDVARMATTFFLPPGEGPFPVVVFSHGRAPGADGRAGIEVGVSRAQLRYWLAKGVAVVSPVRPGYGHSTGGDVEDSGVRHDSAGRCVTRPDYRKTADAAVLTVSATLAWLHDQPWADTGDVLLVGQSVGGLTTVAAGALNLPGVVGTVNFAGGSGGNPERSPGVSCDPGQLESLYARYGKSTREPSLWMYAMNDQYWGPDEPVKWHAAFAQGGSATTFVHADAVPDGDGHGLSRHAASMWAPAVDAFVARIGFPARTALAAGAASSAR
jgi:dienelactone hydrolase